MTFSFDEHVFNSNLPIKYVFEKGTVNKNNLVVVFSGFTSPNAPNQHQYNYMRTLRQMDCNKLFILDNYGPRGCYYIGEKMSFEVESSVMSLIMYHVNLLDIKLKDVICAGSSKGGTAALYYGLKYSMGHIVIGSPQVLIGEYVSYVTKETAQYMMGLEPDPASRKKLNDLLFLQVKKPLTSKISVLTSKKDWQYEKHLLPFINEYEKENKNLEVTFDDRIKDHVEIANYYPEFLIDKLISIFYGIKISKPSYSITENKLKLNYSDASKSPDGSIEFSVSKKDGDTQVVIGPAEIVLDEPGIYSITYKIKFKENVISSGDLGTTIFGGKYFCYRGYDISIKGHQLDFKLDVVEKVPLQYAYYIFKDSLIVEKIWYSRNHEMLYDLKETGSYEVGFFILSPDGHKVISRSRPLKYTVSR